MTVNSRLMNIKGITRAEALEWLCRATASSEALDELCAEADRVRREHMGAQADTCSIMNARSGRCSEDCKWCSQSAHHRTDVEIYPLVGAGEALRHARDNYTKGIGRFSLVTSGRAMNDAEIGRACDIYRLIAAEMPELSLCASMGLLSLPQLRRLREAGVVHYHCNIETAPSHFPSLCTTHTMGEKLATIRAAMEAGLKVCSGGIIGMGETEEQRLEMAFTLRDLGVLSIPVNILNPIPGTRLEAQAPLSEEEILTTFALFRLINPQAFIRFAGGRTLLSRDLQRRLLRSGANAAIMGDMLTTLGSTVAEDRAMFRDCGFEL